MRESNSVVAYSLVLGAEIDLKGLGENFLE